MSSKTYATSSEISALLISNAYIYRGKVTSHKHEKAGFLFHFHAPDEVQLKSSLIFFISTTVIKQSLLPTKSIESND